MQLNAIEFLEFGKSQKTPRHHDLHYFIISVPPEIKNSRITFPINFSRMLREKKCMQLKIGINKLENKMYFIFVAEGGIKLGGTDTDRDVNLTIGKQDVLKAVLPYTNYKEGDERVHVTLKDLGNNSFLLVKDEK